MRASRLIPLGDRPPLWREARFGLEAAALLRDPIFRGDGVSAGRGRPVLLIPGFLAGDGSLSMMAGWLKRGGYRPSRAGMVANVNCAGTVMPRLEERLERLVSEQGQKAAIVGQSRGGTLAKLVALRRPDLVCGIVTLGSPNLDPLAINALLARQVALVAALGQAGMPGFFRRECLAGDCADAVAAELARPWPSGLPYVAVYSRRDAVVDWRACLDPAAEHVEVDASHVGMGVNPAVYAVLGARLGALAAPATAFGATG